MIRAKVTPKQRAFVKAYLEGPKNQFGTGNGTLAAMKAYDTTKEYVAKNIASENLTKPNVLALLESQASISAQDLVDIRAELKESKKDYSVRAKVNQDILDRAGFGKKEDTPSQNINIIMMGYGHSNTSPVPAQASPARVPEEREEV